jgi:prevent-host-death family protein
MEHHGVKRLSTSEVKTHFGRIVHEVATTGTPVIIQTRGEDQAVIVSLRDFQTLGAAAETPAEALRDRVRAALRTADLLSEPTAQEIEEIETFEAAHSPVEQKRTLAVWRRLQLSPSLSDIILQNREPEFD